MRRRGLRDGGKVTEREKIRRKKGEEEEEDPEGKIKMGRGG